MNTTKYLVTAQELCSVPIPQQTSTYKPVKYCDLIDLTLQGARDAGLNLIRETYQATDNRQVATAYYDFNYGNDSEMGLRIAWQNSYNKKISLKFAIGAHVFICTNGAFFGDIGSFKKKHVGEIQTVTPEMIKEYINTAKLVFSKLLTQRDEMKAFKIEQYTAATVVAKLYFFEDLLTETQIAIIKRELKKSTHNYNAPGTLWELYNHITYSLKGLHPSKYIEVHTAVHECLVNMFGLTPIKQVENGN